MMLAQTRPEKAREMTELVYAIRNAIADKAGPNKLNIAESVNAMAQALASVLVGAYNKKNREIVLSAFPDVVRVYYRQWEQIYAPYGHTAANITSAETT